MDRILETALQISICFAISPFILHRLYNGGAIYSRQYIIRLGLYAT